MILNDMKEITKTRNGWTETTLGNLCTKIGSGATPRGGQEAYIDQGISLIRSQNILDFMFSKKGLAFIDEKQAQALSNVEVKENDILINITGDSVARVCIVPKSVLPARVNQHVAILRTNGDELNYIFLHYYLLNPAYKRHLLLVANSGGTRNALTKGILEKLDIILPPFPEQRAIAAVLSSLDDKIELLREQNKTLEETAQAIFKEWFVYNDDFKKQRLGDLVEVKRGGSPRPIQNYISETGLRWLKISDASATISPFIFKIKERIKKEGLKKTTLLKAGSLVLSNSATPGIPKILAVDSCIHDGWLHFPKSSFSNEFLYLLFKEIRLQLIQQGSGSVFTNLKTDILKDFEAPLPDEKTLGQFDNLINPIFRKIFNNASQIQTLSILRDLLLPRLMRGDVRVQNLII